jgi:hypothetical protein
MPSDALRHYLQDHLAGSVAALQLMETLADHERGSPLEQQLRTLHSQVSEEQNTLREILDRLGGGEGALRQVAGWLTEKAHAARLLIAGRTHPALARLDGLESLALGLQGKLSLYRALQDVSPGEPRLGGYPFAALEARTLEQYAMVERERRGAAREAFTPETDGRGPER